MTERFPLLWVALAAVLSVPPVVENVSSVLLPVYAPLQRVHRFTQDFAAYREAARINALQNALARGDFPVLLSDSTVRADRAPLAILVDARPMDFPQELLLKSPQGNEGDLLLMGTYFAGRITRRRGRLLHGVTLYHPSVCVSARPKHGTAWGMLCGGRPPRLRFIPLYHPLQPGDTVITAGVGEVPEGLLLGKILRVIPSQVDPGFWEAEVRPLLSYHTTRYYRVEATRP